MLTLLSFSALASCAGPSTCPESTEQIRYDQGMTYLGKALAERGYAVLIPDLGTLWATPDEEGTDPGSAGQGHARLGARLWGLFTDEGVEGAEDPSRGYQPQRKRPR